MKDIVEIEILSKTIEDLPVGLGIFHVHDLEDIKSIEYVFMNKVILYEMRKEREEVFGKKIIEVAPEAFEHEGGLHVLETYRKVAAEGGSINLGLVEYSNHMVAGSYDCSVHHIKDNYVYVMLRNVTELEQVKNKLEMRNKDLSQFAFIVSHDLQEPLRNVSNLINIIAKQYSGKLDKQADKMLELIYSATKRMSNLIGDLLKYSSIGKEKKKTVVDCNDLVNIIKQDLALKIKEYNAVIEVDDLPKVRGYDTLLRLLFQNLISNAIKFRKKGIAPIVKVGVEGNDNDNWIFSIQDNGIGVSKDNLDQIFNVFKRLHSKEEYEGTGIGLAHCKKIIEIHKGNIWVDSVPGEGSTFYFSIPK